MRPSTRLSSTASLPSLPTHTSWGWAFHPGDYIVCFDPIDGSSNIDAAVTTGSIFAIYDPGECELDFEDDAETVVSKCITNTQQAGDEIRAAGYCMYSSSCVFVLTVRVSVVGAGVARCGREGKSQAGARLKWLSPTHPDGMGHFEERHEWTLSSLSSVERVAVSPWHPSLRTVSP